MENHPKKSSLRVRVRVTARKRGRELNPSCGGSSSDDRKRRDREWFNNSVRKLQRREIGELPQVVRGASSSAPEKFRNIRLQEEFDTYDPSAHWFLRLQFLKKRSKIIEIVAAKDVIFALAQSGLCAAFSRTTNKRICFLNISPDEVIRSLFYNKNNDSLITVSLCI